MNAPTPGGSNGTAGFHEQQKFRDASDRKKFLAIGCLTLFVLVAIGGGFAYKGIKSLFSGVMEKYTDASPMALPSVDVSEEEAAEVLERLDAFVRAVQDNASPRALVLTANDINTLINRHPHWNGLAGKVYVMIEEDRITGRASIPLDGFSSFFKGRYLNGAVLFRIDMVSGRLLLFIDAVEVGGKPLPEEFMSSLRAQNLAEDVNKDSESVAVLEKLASITVRDGQLIIVPKATMKNS